MTTLESNKPDPEEELVDMENEWSFKLLLLFHLSLAKEKKTGIKAAIQ